MYIIQCLVSLLRLGIKYCNVFSLYVYDVFDMRHYNKLLLTFAMSQIFEQYEFTLLFVPYIIVYDLLKIFN